jgi:hypothetical protein
MPSAFSRIAPPSSATISERQWQAPLVNPLHYILSPSGLPLRVPRAQQHSVEGIELDREARGAAGTTAIAYYGQCLGASIRMLVIGAVIELRLPPFLAKWLKAAHFQRELQAGLLERLKHAFDFSRAHVVFLKSTRESLGVPAKVRKRPRTPRCG